MTGPIRAWIEYDGEDDVFGISIADEGFSVSLVDITHAQMKSILEKLQYEFDDLSKLRSSEVKSA